VASIDQSAQSREELELRIARVFDAPRSIVFKAWTEPERLAQWWGPRGFSLPSCEIDLRPGGAYRFTMRGPDGDEHWSQGVFHEIVEPERIVMAGCWVDRAGNPISPQSVITVTLEKDGDKTKLTLHHRVFESEASRDAHSRGWSSSMECLAEYLADAG
jgi:uncharacterized protein YndB with AHSA1/START domain